MSYHHSSPKKVRFTLKTWIILALVLVKFGLAFAVSEYRSNQSKYEIQEGVIALAFDGKGFGSKHLKKETKLLPEGETWLNNRYQVYTATEGPVSVEYEGTIVFGNSAKQIAMRELGKASEKAGKAVDKFLNGSSPLAKKLGLGKDPADTGQAASDANEPEANVAKDEPVSKPQLPETTTATVKGQFTFDLSRKSIEHIAIDKNPDYKDWLSKVVFGVFDELPVDFALIPAEFEGVVADNLDTVLKKKADIEPAGFTMEVERLDKERREWLDVKSSESFNPVLLEPASPGFYERYKPVGVVVIAGLVLIAGVYIFWPEGAGHLKDGLEAVA